jgi:hypothetical protein
MTSSLGLDTSVETGQEMKPRDVYRVVRLKLHTGDLPGARAFYTELCG